jgi:1-acyl-sn-glycerol-3-phosphate acyltransferase
MITLPIIFSSFFKRTSDLPQAMVRCWARFTLFCADTNVEVTGMDNIPGNPAIFMANHTSFFDVFSILGHIDTHFIWVVKKELFSIPALGIAMKRCGHISIDRGEHEKALRSINHAVECIRSGQSIFIFPEGTRSGDGEFRYPLKKGGFHLALQSEVPIVPITIIGSKNILPKDGKIIKPGNIKIVIGSPIYPECHDTGTLMAEVFSAINNPLSLCRETDLKSDVNEIT